MDERSQATRAPVTVGVAHLGEDDLAGLVGRLSRDDLRRLSEILNIRVNTRSVRGGLSRLCLVQLRKVRPRNRQAAVEILVAPVFDAAIEALGEHAANPSVEQLREVTPGLVSTFGASAVRLTYLFGVQTRIPATGELLVVLEDELLQPPEPTEPDLSERTAPEPALTPTPTPAPAASGTGPDRSPPDTHAGDTATTPGAVQPRSAGDVAVPGPTPEVSTPTEDEQPEDDAASFTTLDKVLISALVASVNDVQGAVELDDMAGAVSEFVSLNGSRHSSMFHAGFLAGMTGRQIDLPRDGLNESRREWELFGRLCGLIRRGESKLLLDAALESPDHTEHLLDDPNRGSTITAPLVRAAMRHEPSRVAWVVRSRTLAFSEAPLAFREVEHHARSLLLEGQPLQAEEVFEALMQWSGFRRNAALTRVELIRRMAACRRARSDWAGAERLLDDIGDGPLPATLAALVAAERGMIAASVPVLTALRFPESDDEADTLAESLAKGETHFSDALTLSDRQMHASVCLGLLAWCTDRQDDAARLLRLAMADLGHDDLLESTEFAWQVRIHQAVAALGAGDLGSAGDVVTSIEMAAGDGHRPSVHLLGLALACLAPIDSAHFPTLVTLATTVQPSAVLGTLDDLEQAAAEGRTSCPEAARRVSAYPPLDPVRRLGLLTAAAEGFLLRGETAPFEEAIEEVEDLLGDAANADLDEMWADTLEHRHAIRSAIGGTEAILARVRLWWRNGQVDRAAAAVETLFYRAASGDLHGYSTDDLLGLLAEMGVDEERTEPLRRTAGQRLEPDLDRTNKVAVLFIGGDVRQERYDTVVTEDIGRKLGDRVSVHWLHSGWDSNWSEWADRAAGLYAQVDIVVLNPFMRTNLGRRLRREIGEAGLEWRACTGHGRQSIELAILDAVAIADAKFDTR